MVLEIPLIIWISGIFLAVMALFDLKKKKMPSIIGTTGILACSLILLYKNPPLLLFGILGFVFGYLLYEIGMFKGMADIKATILVSLTVATVLEFSLFLVIVAAMNLSYVFVLSKIFKIKHQEEIPLIPMFFLVWGIMLFI